PIPPPSCRASRSHSRSKSSQRSALVGSSYARTSGGSPGNSPDGAARSFSSSASSCASSQAWSSGPVATRCLTCGASEVQIDGRQSRVDQQCRLALLLGGAATVVQGAHV